MNVIAGENSHYDFSWLDPDKEIFVLQNRTYQKDGHAYINLGGGFTASGAFVDSINMQGRFGYFFTEELGVEFLYSKNSGKENDTAQSVRRGPDGSGTIPFRRIIDQYYGAYFLWSPFYAKVNTFNKIIYLDWILGVGYAYMTETNNTNELGDNGVGTFNNLSESHHSLSWDIGLKFYLSSSFDIRLDLTALHYQTPSVVNLDSEDKSWFSHYDVSLSLGYKF